MIPITIYGAACPKRRAVTEKGEAMRAKRVAMLLAIVVCSAGMAMGQTEWVEYADNPVIGPGEPGEWDEDGREVLEVVFDGSTYHLFFGDPGQGG